MATVASSRLRRNRRSHVDLTGDYALLVAKVRLFASAREAAGTGTDVIDGATVGEVLVSAERRYGVHFADVLKTCKVWVNGDAVESDHQVGPDDELAVLPPVSGGAI
jgi:molybdopterin converting factor small subunit